MTRIVYAVFLYCISLPVSAICPHLETGIPKQSDQVLCREGYALGYNYNLKSAEWVSYRLDREVRPGVERHDNFRVDPDIPTQYQTTPKDYKEPVYHLGHLANAESIDKTLTASSETFLMSNIVPQLPGHNIGIWKGIENRERKWADIKGVVYVVLGVIYKEPIAYIGDRVPVPSAFWKVVFDPIGKRVIAYLTPHKKLYTRDLPKYMVSVDEIEREAGVDLLSFLSVSDQRVIESEPAKTQWLTKKIK